MSFVFFLFILILGQICCNLDIAQTYPDLVVKNITAFKSINNDLILKNNQTSKFKDLLWYSVGSDSFQSNEPIYSSYFNFWLHTKSLTNEHKELLKKQVKEKYNFTINIDQIKHLFWDAATSFSNCSLFLKKSLRKFC